MFTWIVLVLLCEGPMPNEKAPREPVQLDLPEKLKQDLKKIADQLKKLRSDVPPAPPQEAKSPREIAERELRKHGAIFKSNGMYGVYEFMYQLMLDDPEDEASRKRRKESIYLTFGKDWTGGREKLKCLRDLPNLKEVVFGLPDFTDRWCVELQDLTQLESLFFFGTAGLTDRGLSELNKLQNLQALCLVDASITDEGLLHLKGMKKLRWLSLGGTRISNKGLAHLKDLTNLEYINLDQTSTSVKGLVHLQALTKLRELRFMPMSGCTDEELQYLRNMNKFKSLNLSSTYVTDQGLEHLAGLTALEDLSLCETLVTGAGLKHLKNLQNLKYLDLRASAIEDGAAVHLRELKGLKELRIEDTKMSKKVIEELKRQLPNTKIR